MKILFSPSETKCKDQSNIDNSTKSFDSSSFIFPKLYDKRIEIIDKYRSYIQNAGDDELIRLFGTKKLEVVEYYKTDIFNKPIMKVIQRYSGIAYDYLKYNTLPKSSQDYIDNNTLIFSNLFGVLLAGDLGIPDYKLKQGESLYINNAKFNIEKFYKEEFSDTIDNYLEDEDILDLRAGFYEKFYTITQPYTTMKFVKNNKVVSHWAKAYRGILLKQMSINNIQTTQELLDLQIDNLQIQEIQKSKYKTNIVYKITN